MQRSFFAEFKLDGDAQKKLEIGIVGFEEMLDLRV
jgi:hypothetical protein